MFKGALYFCVNLRITRKATALFYKINKFSIKHWRFFPLISLQYHPCIESMQETSAFFQVK